MMWMLLAVPVVGIPVLVLIAWLVERGGPTEMDVIRARRQASMIGRLAKWRQEQINAGQAGQA